MIPALVGFLIGAVVGGLIIGLVLKFLGKPIGQVEFDTPKAFKIGFTISVISGLINMVLGLIHPALGLLGLVVAFVTAMLAIHKMGGVTMGRSAGLSGIILAVYFVIGLVLGVVLVAIGLGAAAVSGGATP